MGWAGVAIAAAQVASSIIGLRQGSSGLAESLQALHLSLDTILKNQILIGDSVAKISANITELHKQIENLPLNTVDAISQTEISSITDELLLNLKLAQQTKNQEYWSQRCIELLESLPGATIHLKTAFFDGGATIHAFRPATLAMSAAYTACLVLKSINKLPDFAPDLYTQIYDAARATLTGLNDPEKGVPAMIAAVSTLIAAHDYKINGLSNLFKDPVIWRQTVQLADLYNNPIQLADMITGLTSVGTEVPSSLRSHYVKIREKNASSYVRVDNTSTYGEHDVTRGYTVTRYSERVYEFELRTRLTVLAGRFPIVEFEEIIPEEMKNIGAYVWEIKEDASNRKTKRYQETPQELILYKDDIGNLYEARNISNEEILGEIELMRQILIQRNNYSLLAAQYEALRLELVDIIDKSQFFREIYDGNTRTFE